MDNPLLKLYREVTPNKFEEGDYIRNMEARTKLTREYAWAVPNDEAISTISSHSPIVEMGAGAGYWAHLLRNAGCDIIAYDKWVKEMSPFELNIWNTGNKFTEVFSGDPSSLSKHNDRTLFLCWPPYGDPMASECLKHWKGNKVIYVGEADGGTCATDDFFEQLCESFLLQTVVNIPQWFGIHDVLTVWERNGHIR